MRSRGSDELARSARVSVVAALALALLPGAAQAQTTDVTIRLTPAVAPLQTGVTHGLDSTLALDVVNTNDQGSALRHVRLRVPYGYALRASSRGPAGFTPTISGQEILFQAPCSASGIPAGGGLGQFLLDVTPPREPTPNDVSETLGLVSVGDGLCGGDTDWRASSGVPFVRRVLQVVSGQVTSVSGGLDLTSATVTWTVQNRSSTSRLISLSGGGIAGFGTVSCGSAWVPAGTIRTATCTYGSPTSSATSFVFAARASSGGSATAVGASFTYTSYGARVEWLWPVAVTGRAPHAFTIRVANQSSVTVNRVEVFTPSGWSGPSAVQGVGGLAPDTGCASGTACFGGTLRSGNTAELTFRFASAPPVTQNTQYAFPVRVRRQGGGGATVTRTQAVTLVAPLPDVSGLTVLSDADGQVLSWTNTSRADSAHDGVVIFRTTAPAVPPQPVDFTEYATSPLPAGVVYADAGGSTRRDFADPAVGAFNYRVCNRDAFRVYSGCRTSFWNNQGYADSAVARGAWTHQLGGQSLLLPTIIPGNRVAIPTNRPAIDVLDLATGQRLFDPVPLPSIPASSTPATRVVDGRLLLFAADQSGTVTAVDIEAGAVAWPPRAKAGESFVAGVSGITRSFGGAAFQAAYDMDILLLGSATTGNVLAIDATTGETLWTVNAGAPVRALITYDSAAYRFYVPTSGGGVVAFDMGPSRAKRGEPAVPAVQLASWQNPGGTYSLYCARAHEAGSIACIDRTGLLQVFEGATGAVRASLATGISSPSSLIRVNGSSPGFVVSNATQVQRLAASGTPTVLSTVGTWLPTSGGISSALILSVSGYIIVPGSDGALHRLRLSDAQWLSQSPALPAVTSPRFLGPIAYDTANGLYVFGSSEGRVWAIPTSSF